MQIHGACSLQQNTRKEKSGKTYPCCAGCARLGLTAGARRTGWPIGACRPGSTNPKASIVPSHGKRVPQYQMICHDAHNSCRDGFVDARIQRDCNPYALRGRGFDNGNQRVSQYKIIDVCINESTSTREARVAHTALRACDSKGTCGTCWAGNVNYRNTARTASCRAGRSRRCRPRWWPSSRIALLPSESWQSNRVRSNKNSDATAKAAANEINDTYQNTMTITSKAIRSAMPIESQTHP